MAVGGWKPLSLSSHGAGALTAGVTPLRSGSVFVLHAGRPAGCFGAEGGVMTWCFLRQGQHASSAFSPEGLPPLGLGSSQPCGRKEEACGGLRALAGPPPVSCSWAPGGSIEWGAGASGCEREGSWKESLRIQKLWENKPSLNASCLFQPTSTVIWTTRAPRPFPGPRSGTP